METLDKQEVVNYVEEHIGRFHQKRADRLKELKLKEVLLRKNPYLFKAKSVVTAHDIIKMLLDAHLSSQEETIFGEFLEGLAVFTAGRVFGGKKSSAEGIDLELERDGAKYVMSIKSGPNWGNSQQIARMKDNFLRARRVLHTNTQAQNVIAVSGCCYGQCDIDYGNYIKVCGQAFWSLVSGDENFFIDIIEPVGVRAHERNEEFMERYNQIVNLFTEEFMRDFCRSGYIDWDKLVRFNSARKAQKRKKQDD